jgi:hypothetical protein
MALVQSQYRAPTARARQGPFSKRRCAGRVLYGCSPNQRAAHVKGPRPLGLLGGGLALGQDGGPSHQTGPAPFVVPLRASFFVGHGGPLAALMAVAGGQLGGPALGRVSARAPVQLNAPQPPVGMET